MMKLGTYFSLKLQYKLKPEGIGDGLDDFTIKYNRKKVGGSLIENSDAAYDIVKTQLDPLLKDHLDYLDFIRKDKVGYGNNISDGKIYRTLYDDDTQFFSQKITSAQRPGIHAEILAVDDIIKRMKDSGTNINSLQDLITNNVKVIVKGLNHGHMVMCPHCFTILKDINIVIE